MPLPTGYNDVVMGVKQQFDREVLARSAEAQHTLSLTRAQRYVLRELRVLHAETRDEDLRRQISVVEAAFRRPQARPAVRDELNRAMRERLSGEALLGHLSHLYQAYRLDEARAQEKEEEGAEPAVPLIVCSEAIVA